LNASSPFNCWNNEDPAGSSPFKVLAPASPKVPAPALPTLNLDCSNAAFLAS